MELKFTPRDEISYANWDYTKESWVRPELDLEIIKELSIRNSQNALVRLGVFLLFLISSAFAALYVFNNVHWAAAIPLLYIYYFFYGFIVAPAHELQHKIVFDKSLDWLSEIFFYFFQILMWNSPRYARISHRLHHRYTMVRGKDPETNWPEVIGTKFLKHLVFNLAARFLVVGAVYELAKTILLQIKRIAGFNDEIMSKFCKEKDIRTIRIESFIILVFHTIIALFAVISGFWPLLLLITIAWHIGFSMESVWHFTEHINRIYLVNDQILCTRSICVSPFIHLIYWGLDDHVDHHYFPSVPSCNLPRLHSMLKDKLAEPKNVIGCWREMFAIAKEKDSFPEHEFVPVPRG